jgi:hypothetical protein
MNAPSPDRSATGVVLSGRVIGMPELNVIPPASHGGPACAALDPGDFRPRPALWLRQLIAAARRHGFTRWRDVA